MKRFIAFAMALSVASCDTTMKAADGTSSETQTSLEALATRFDGIAPEASATQATAFAAGEGASGGGGASLEAMWKFSSSVKYVKEAGLPGRFEQWLDSNVRTSSDEYRHSYTYTMANGQLRRWRHGEGTYRVCPDSAGRRIVVEMPPPCGEAIEGAPDVHAHRDEFRNGTVLTTDTPHKSPESYLVDGRWTLRPSTTLQNGTDRWWDVLEKGRLIGHARQKGLSWSSDDDVDTYLGTLSTMKIFDLAGVEVPPDRSLPTPWFAFPEDSLGLSIDSASVDSLKRRLRIVLSWRFKSGPELPLDTIADLHVSWRDPDCWRAAAECDFSHDGPIRIRSERGTEILDIPLDSLAVKHPKNLGIWINSRKESLVGSLSRQSYAFEASIEIGFSGRR